MPAVLNLATLGSRSGMKITAANNAYMTGYLVSGIGDINGDGIPDMCISKDKQIKAVDRDSIVCVAESYVVFGNKHMSDSNSMNLLNLNGTNGCKVSDMMGYTFIPYTGYVTGKCKQIGHKVGDINGDGIDDFMISHPWSSTPGIELNTGEAFSIFGKTTGFNATLDVSNSSNAVRISEECYEFASNTRLKTKSETQLGYFIGGGGDINGDGKPDMVIGDRYSVSGGPDRKEVYVIFGGASFASNIEELNGINGFGVIGFEGRSFNGAVCIGDINGDGISDVVMSGVPLFGGLHKGYVIFGRHDFSALDPFDLSFLNGTNGFQWVGGALKYSSRIALACGDINGDGKDDIAIGVFNPGVNVTAGSAYMLFGQDSFNATVDLDASDGVNVVRVIGSVPGFGISVALGDVNNDGRQDLIIAESSDSCVTGNVYVILGEDFSNDNPYDPSILNGKNGYRIENVDGCSNLGFSVASADVNGNGRDDVIIGSGAKTDGGEVYIVFH